MIQYKHCDLCQHTKRSLKSGMTCGLTNKKPMFKDTCPDIKFSNLFKENLFELLNQIQYTKNKKKSVYFNYFLLFGIGVIIIFGSYALLKQTPDIEFGYSAKIYFEHTILVYIVGTLFLSMAFWNLNKYWRKLKKLKQQKDKIEEILNKYEIDSDILIRK